MKQEKPFNEWIRGNRIFDGIIDFDALLHEPSHPEILSFSYDSGEHFHPHIPGGRSMAELVVEKLISRI